ncbi:UDP-3-O-(3-hydroxymyristoyl)glucosamine N-acyltransferase [Candidatus Desantisbacteria bacterium CG_4_10_14_0_8_um_filter_48_22]|uniref:UDP-3-O-acylglucosamine N-acyltransferase n=1 Tax=Candidatus Desantisbacteria bacterium CG_4_10_14_0_8_um_filter_48_22 TaxID=1974543 RepID=A0A2M7SCF2_9BACT|nr:MAG: UDP-3-O-(3-hydroxymyristoyl)glucosamine N-acyltransferase [Candidatus Desantisbacteria bacterium CG_4_10_14_0_8_um_filter_48_22]
MKKTLGEIAELIGGEVVGDPKVRITELTGIEKAREGSLVFARDVRYLREAEATGVSAVIVPLEIERSVKPIIRVGNPDYAFSKLIEMDSPRKQTKKGIHKTAVIGENVKTGKDIYVGAHAVIEDGSEIGDNTVIYPMVFIGENVKIGSNTLIYANVSIREEASIGNNVIIHNGAVIGSDGFGFVREEGKYHKVPQIGRVVIEDDVEIGANVTVDRATLGETIIKKGTKIDNLVQIAHNVVIGENCAIVAQVGISGSVELRDNVTLAGQVGVSGHLTIGENSVVAGKSGVTKNIPPNSYVSGFPAQPHKEELKIKASLQRLPLLLKIVQELQEKVNKIGKIVGGIGNR